MVEHEWNGSFYGGSASRIFALKLKGLKVRLKGWNKDSADSLKVDMEDCIKHIKLFDLAEEDGSLTREERIGKDVLIKEFQLLAIKEETL